MKDLVQLAYYKKFLESKRLPAVSPPENKKLSPRFIGATATVDHKFLGRIVDIIEHPIDHGIHYRKLIHNLDMFQMYSIFKVVSMTLVMANYDFYHSIRGVIPSC